jgi:serine/threonine protein kinase
VIGPGSLVSGKYRILRLVGDGGMGTVYEAQHEVLGTRVAIKVLHPELVRRSGLVERFLQEARVVAKIRSPHVVQVIDVDRTPDAGDAYIVMELLEGEALSSVVDRLRKLPAPTACEYTTQILEALEAAHSLGVIHRDLKPENVFVTFVAGKPVLKLIDFGIAKLRAADDGTVRKNLTVAGVVMGTAEYMAPEQARSAGEVDARADLYAVGVMLYEMLAGVRPVNGDDARIVALKVERGEVVPLVQVAPEVPRELAGFVHRAMAPRPELRFPTATEMRLALEAAMSGKKGPTAAMPAALAGGIAAAADFGTGTLKGADARDVYANAPPPAGPAGATNYAPPPDMSDPHVDTQRAPPTNIALQAYAPSPQVLAYTPAPPPQPRRRKSNGGKIVLLVAIPLLLGAGSVAAYIVFGPSSDSSAPPLPPTAPPGPSHPKPSASPSSPPSIPPAETLAPLTPLTVKPTPGGPHPPGPGPAPHESDAGTTPGPTPFIPPIPSGFSIPSGWPTALPSSFPLPFPVPQPAPKPGGTASEGPGY